MADHRWVKIAFPWIFVAALLLALAGLYTNNRATELELAVLRRQNQELSSATAENEALKRDRVSTDELARLRKDNEELHRLRNEVRQLREDKKSPAPPRTGQPAAGASGQSQAQLQQLMAENERLRAENQQLQVAGQLAQQSSLQAQVQAQVNACINNLRVIDGAKDQWALENKKPSGVIPRPADLQPYLKDNAIPACPANGFYTLNPVGSAPLCNIPGHAIPRE
jgi:hypothetical protein